ncbi:MAG: hypothetical protein HGA85_08980, partial [Nanoarchaeota archaeon]|nr:hypothetical protein [Nanoarchaeota archaeon]
MGLFSSSKPAAAPIADARAGTLAIMGEIDQFLVNLYQKHDKQNECLKKLDQGKGVTDEDILNLQLTNRFLKTSLKTLKSEDALLTGLLKYMTNLLGTDYRQKIKDHNRNVKRFGLELGVTDDPAVIIKNSRIVFQWRDLLSDKIKDESREKAIGLIMSILDEERAFLNSLDSLDKAISAEKQPLQDYQKLRNPELIRPHLLAGIGNIQSVVTEYHRVLDSFIKNSQVILDALTACAGKEELTEVKDRPKRDMAILAIYNYLKKPVETVGLKAVNFSAVDRLLYPYPQSGIFGKKLDPWNIYRDTVMSGYISKFALIFVSYSQEKGEYKYSMDTFFHTGRNAQTAISEFHGERSSNSIKDCMVRFSEETGADIDHKKTLCTFFTFPYEIYNRGKFYSMVSD